MSRILSCLCGIVLPLVLVASEPAAPPKHLADAVNLLKTLSADNTSYRHKDTVVKWSDGAGQGECHTDCSGFLNSLIEHSYPQHDTDSLKRWLGKARPTADSYYEAIKAKRGFSRITEIADIQPGDIIAVKYPPKSTSGLGKGVLRLYTANSGAVVGYSWSVQGASEFHDDKTKALVIGRLDPKFRPDDKMK
jgi:hypothetical protein